jgi:hypothetical protein
MPLGAALVHAAALANLWDGLLCEPLTLHSLDA